MTPDRTADHDRDRDPEGRAENQRPRDALGRPLPYGAEGVPRVPADAEFTPEEGLSEAQRLLDAGYAFNAHEVLEAVWKSAPEPERELWRGLAQVAVGITHAQRGNRVGAARLLRRGADRVASYGPHGPYRVAIIGVTEHARRLASDIEVGSTNPVEPAGLRLRD